MRSKLTNKVLVIIGATLTLSFTVMGVSCLYLMYGATVEQQKQHEFYDQAGRSEHTQGTYLRLKCDQTEKICFTHGEVNRKERAGRAFSSNRAGGP